MIAKPPEPKQLFPRARIWAGCGVFVTLWFVACTDTSDDLFTTLDPLGKATASNGGGGGSGPTGVGTDPSPIVGSSGTGNSAAQDPVTASAGAASTPRPPRPPRPPRATGDAGVATPEADAGGAPAIPTDDDGSCGDLCSHNGGLCSAGTCFFDCRATGSCAVNQVICPAGVPCDVTCGDRACASNVLCRANSVCNIRCEGEGSCGRELICEGTCNTTCSGLNSCPGGSGGSVQHLNLKCTGTGSCGSTVQCEGDDCKVACSGSQSCAHVRIFGTTNTLVCSGAASCGTDVFCDGTRCGVQCARNACAKDVKCQAASCQVGELEDGASSD
jgi:hypothetical protein